MDPADFHKTVPAPKIVPINDSDDLGRSPTRSTFSGKHVASPPSYGVPDGEPAPQTPDDSRRRSTSSRRRSSPPRASMDRPLPKVPSNDVFEDTEDTQDNQDNQGAALAAPFGGFQPGTATATASNTASGCNPFGVDLVIPYDLSARGADDRNEALYDTQAGYTRLIASLESVGGLRIASRPGRAGKGAEEMWVFVGASDAKVAQLVEAER